jgi:hypothetical protein
MGVVNVLQRQQDLLGRLDCFAGKRRKKAPDPIEFGIFPDEPIAHVHWVDLLEFLGQSGRQHATVQATAEKDADFCRLRLPQWATLPLGSTQQDAPFEDKVKILTLKPGRCKANASLLAYYLGRRSEAPNAASTPVNTDGVRLYYLAT